MNVSNANMNNPNCIKSLKLNLFFFISTTPILCKNQNRGQPTLQHGCPFHVKVYHILLDATSVKKSPGNHITARGFLLLWFCFVLF
jgi:hypothetical protein